MLSFNIVKASRDNKLVRVEVDNEIDTVAKQLLLCKGGSSKPILCIQGHSTFDGFYVTDKVLEEEGSHVIYCSATGVESKYVEENYLVSLHFGRLRLLRKRRTEEEGHTTAAEAPQILMLPPLTLRSRVSIFNIDKIDTIAQSFQTDFYCELRLVAVIDTDDREGVETLMQHYRVSVSLIDFLNISEVIGEKEVWDQMEESQDNGCFSYVIKLRMKAVINEQMEVHTFPFDIQPMCIALTLNACSSRAALEINDFYPSIFFTKQFQSASVYDVVYGDIVLAELQVSDPSESSAGYTYPRCMFNTYFSRRPAYYLSNVVMPMTLLTLLGPLSNAIEADGSLMGTGDRLSVSLTLLLTAVAYKFIVATLLPQVSYLTALDVQVLLCFGFLVLSAVENVVFPYLAARFDVDSSFELYFVISYYCGFVVAHLVLFKGLVLWLVRRREFFRTDLLARRVSKDACQSLASSRVTGCTSDRALVGFVVDRALASRELQKCCSVAHPRHVYAVTGVHSTLPLSNKVGAEQQQQQQQQSSLVGSAEILSGVEAYHSRSSAS